MLELLLISLSTSRTIYMKKLGTILSLFTVPHDKEQVAADTLLVDTKGILGDKHYDKNNERAILITASDSYRLVERELGITLPKGYLGENLLVSESPYHLEPGTQLSIGETVLEITQGCTLCKHLATLDKRIPKLLKDDRGIFAKVVKEGEITSGEDIYIK